jgi:glycosyltransferase involved in cell wall biosynthesis
VITIIIPAFNEELRLAPTIGTIRNALAAEKVDAVDIVIIDDGSRDTTPKVAAELAAQPDIRVVTHPENRGMGAAIRSGLAAAKGQSFMILPADDAVSVSAIRILLRYRDQADMILTVNLNKEFRNLARNLVSMTFQAIYMIAFSIYVQYVNGPGIWPVASARAADLKSNRFSIIAELNVKLLRMGHTFAEVPSYFLPSDKARRTVTLRNFREVVAAFFRLLVVVHVTQRAQYGRRPSRKMIDFVEH